MKTLAYCFVLLVSGAPALAATTPEERPTFALDERVWVLFYDLPSRRFRGIRDAFIRRDFASAGRDLRASEGFMRVEISRADPALVPPMTEVADRLLDIANNLDQRRISVRDLDPVFARAHWLLAQHYLAHAIQARDHGQHRSAGNNLMATAHHLERSVIWSDARMGRELLDALDGMRTMAERLRSDERPQRVYRDKPIYKARLTLRELGEFLDRKVWIEQPKQ